MTNQKQDDNSAQPNTTNNNVRQDLKGNEGQVLGQANNGSQANHANRDQHINNYYQILASKNIPSSELPQPKKPIPSLLPYLANRSEQERELRGAIETYLQQRSNNPFICIFHGDEYQCHEKFFERLQKKYLPRFLKLDDKQAVIKDYPLSYPSRVTKSKEFSERLCLELAEKVEQDNFASTAEINQTFSQYPCPIIIKTDLLTQDWKDKRAKPLDSLLSFWNNWPQLAPNQQLIVCISIKYELKKDRNNKSFWWSKILEFWKNRNIEKLLKLLKCYQYSKHNKTIEKQLCEVNFSQFGKLNGVVLSELSGISKSEVQAWANAIDTQEYIGEEMLQQLIIYIRDIFDRRDNTHISMEDLANELRDTLEKLTSTSKYSI